MNNTLNLSYDFRRFKKKKKKYTNQMDYYFGFTFFWKLKRSPFIAIACKRVTGTLLKISCVPWKNESHIGWGQK